MGNAIADLAAAADDLVLAGIWLRGGDLDALTAAADVVIDFSLPEATAGIMAMPRGMLLEQQEIGGVPLSWSLYPL